MANKKSLSKGDPAGVLDNARQMVSQLQEQAKNGQIDGAMLDQLAATLDVTVDTAEDVHEEGQSAMSAVSKTEDPTNPPDTSAPEEEAASAEEESTEEPSSEPFEEESSEDEDETYEPEEESTMTSVPKTEKAAQPLSTKPPKTNLIFDKVEDYNSKLPDFIEALSGEGSIKKAQMIAGKDNKAFDTMFHMAQVALLNEGGWRSDNLEKLSGMAQIGSGKLAKGITASSVPGVYLIKLAKLMLPLYAGMTNRIPAQSPTGMSSNQAMWKAQLGYGSLNTSSFFRILEAAVGVNPPTDFLTFTAPFNDISVQDDVTLKALAASQGYSDPMQISVIKSMTSLLMGQEKVILGSNVAAIAAPASLTLTAGSTGGTISNSGSAGAYQIKVTALTYEGWLAGSKGGSAAIGESVAVSGSVATGTGSTNSILCEFPAVENAVAYNVYISPSGGAGSTAVYNKTVTVNKATITAASTSSNVPPAADTTANAAGIEGLIGQCSLSTLYGQSIPGKLTMSDNAGAGLSVGNGGITEFDEILARQWSEWQIAPSLMIMSPNMNATVVGKLLGTGGAGGFYRLDVTQERNTVNGGMMVTGYVNKFAPFADGTPKMIDIIPHPYMPDGTILFMCETIPYPMANESRAFVRDVLVPYTYFPLPSQVGGTNKILYNYSITTSEVLEGFLPSPQCALVGVDYTL